MGFKVRQNVQGPWATLTHVTPGCNAVVVVVVVVLLSY